MQIYGSAQQCFWKKNQRLSNGIRPCTQTTHVTWIYGQVQHLKLKQEHHEEGSLEEVMLAQEGSNEEDAKGILKPTYVLGDIYLIRLERPPFFGFARWRGKRYSKKFGVFWIVCANSTKL